MENEEAGGRHDLVIVLDANKLARACVARGWNFGQLARHARISRPTMAAALHGRSLRPLTAWKIAHALGQGAAAPELIDLIGQD
jgi:hypothetical protein